MTIQHHDELHTLFRRADVTEGVLTCIRRVDGGVMLKIGSGEFFIGVSPLGPLLNHEFGHVEIIANLPNPEGGA